MLTHTTAHPGRSLGGKTCSAISVNRRRTAPAATSIGICGKDPDVQSLQETLLYGLKGMAAYAHHARRLGKVDEAVDAFTEEALFATVTNVNFDIPTLLELVLECGKQNLRVMQMLDEAHVERFGKPAPTEVCRAAPRPSPAS